MLPFANLSGDPAQAYFSDGIAEELRDALTRIAGLKVAGRSSSELMRDADGPTAAAKLGVANILSGTVRRGAGMIRINAELVDGISGLTRWSQAYDRADRRRARDPDRHRGECRQARSASRSARRRRRC